MCAKLKEIPGSQAKQIEAALIAKWGSKDDNIQKSVLKRP